jgi:hypothetical protein
MAQALDISDTLARVFTARDDPLAQLAAQYGSQLLAKPDALGLPLFLGDGGIIFFFWAIDCARSGGGAQTDKLNAFSRNPKTILFR